MKHFILDQFNRLSSRSPSDHREALLLPLLHAIRDRQGYIADEDILVLSELLELPRIRIDEVLSWYTLFPRTSHPATHITVCHNASCALKNAGGILRYLEDTLSIRAGESTPDGRIHLSTVECLASCGTAPVMQVNGVYHERMTHEKIDELLRGLR